MPLRCGAPCNIRFALLVQIVRLVMLGGLGCCRMTEHNCPHSRLTYQTVVVVPTNDRNAATSIRRTQEVSSVFVEVGCTERRVVVGRTRENKSGMPTRFFLTQLGRTTHFVVITSQPSIFEKTRIYRMGGIFEISRVQGCRPYVYHLLQCTLFSLQRISASLVSVTALVSRLGGRCCYAQVIDGCIAKRMYTRAGIINTQF